MSIGLVRGGIVTLRKNEKPWGVFGCPAGGGGDARWRVLGVGADAGAARWRRAARHSCGMIFRQRWWQVRRAARGVLRLVSPMLL
jgi:hypothetical protein